MEPEKRRRRPSCFWKVCWSTADGLLSPGELNFMVVCLLQSDRIIIHGSINIIEISYSNSPQGNPGHRAEQNRAVKGFGLVDGFSSNNKIIVFSASTSNSIQFQPHGHLLC